MSSLTSPLVAAAGSAHALVSHAVVTWQRALSQGLQACVWLYAACCPSFSAFGQKEVRDMAGKRIIPSILFFFSALLAEISFKYFCGWVWLFGFVFGFFPLFPPSLSAALESSIGVGRLST